MRKELFELQDSGKYVFHGSPRRLALLEPKQAYNDGQPDGEPAVFASAYIEPAIFRAIINKDNEPLLGGRHYSGFGITNDQISYRTTAKSLTNAKSLPIKGYIHILPKELFVKQSPINYRATQTIKPVQIIEVTADDLPEEIEIISWDEVDQFKKM